MENRALKQLNWNDIMDRILNSYNAISKSINPANLYKIELTSSQIKVLATFTERECYSMTELSQMLSVTMPTMTAMIDRLIQSGLVKRERDERDRRVVLVRLTGDGKKVISNLMDIRKQEIEKVLRTLEHEEVEVFLGSIESVAQLLTKARTRVDE
jgi:MarR family transcriptional regulator, organic hydroperoxide resistance regulator